MFSVLLVLLTIVAFFMIILILLQKSEGSGMSGSSAASMFGGALSGASAGNFLTKATAWLATIFFVLCAALAIVVSRTDTLKKQTDLRSELMMPEDMAPPVPEIGQEPVEPITVPVENKSESVPVKE